MKIFITCLMIVVFVVGVIYLVPSIHARVYQILTYSECDSPLQYKIGSVDSQFGLSMSEVMQDMQQATDIWSSASGKPLFAYSPKAKLVVNFVYDQRQALDTSINQLHSQLTQSSQSLDQKIVNYKAKVTSFRQRLSSLNATIEKYNNEGGAPPDVYSDLIKQQNDLRAEGNTLNEEARQLNLATNDYNNNVSVLNNDINQFQNAIAKRPEQGIYNGREDTITMYFADNQDQLIHTLTHEFGHALGMNHVNDSNAIMYPYTTTSLTVTGVDLQQLIYVCRRQSLITHDLEMFDMWFITTLQNLESSSHK